MTDIIRIQPTREQRVPFARWAVAQTPKVRTVSVHAFGVPADLFAGMPEDILVGALVDGRRYVSPDEDAANGTPPPGDELLGVATPDGFALVGDAGPETVVPLPAAPLEGALLDERTAVPGEPLPELPESAYGPDSVPLPPPELSDSSDSSEEVPEGVFPCGACDREFTTERGRDTHHRQKHPEA